MSGRNVIEFARYQQDRAAGKAQPIDTASVTAARREAKIMKEPLGIESWPLPLTGCQHARL